MRALIPLTLLGLLVLGVAGRARGEEGLPSTAEALAQRLERVERQNAWLAAQQQRTGAYLAGHQKIADELRRLTADLRAGGFAAAANPSPTREQLLRGFEQLAALLAKDLPVLSDAQERERAELWK